MDYKKPSQLQLAKEATFVGATLLIVFVLIHVILMMVNTPFSMSHAGIFTGAFLAGFVGHYFYEYSGLNAKFVKDR